MRYKLLNLLTCRSGGMADAPDSKSGRGNPVGVQVPPPAPNPSDFTRSRIHLFSRSHPEGALHNKNVDSQLTGRIFTEEQETRPLIQSLLTPRPVESMWVRQKVSTAIAMERNLTYLYGTLFPCEHSCLLLPQLLSERETSDNGSISFWFYIGNRPLMPIRSFGKNSQNLRIRSPSILTRI